MTREGSRLARMHLTIEIRVPLLVAFAVLGALALPSTDCSPLAWVWLTPALACALNRTPVSPGEIPRPLIGR